MLLLPIVLREADPIVKKIKYLITHNPDGSPNDKYRFGQVGECYDEDDAEVIKQYREDNGLYVTNVIDIDLIEHLGIINLEDICTADFLVRAEEEEDSKVMRIPDKIMTYVMIGGCAFIVLLIAFALLNG